MAPSLRSRWALVVHRYNDVSELCGGGPRADADADADDEMRLSVVAVALDSEKTLTWKD